MNITSTFGIGIIDVVIILAVILFMILGWKNGFLLKIVEMASGIFGLIGSILLARPFSTVLDKWIGEAVSTKVNEYLVSRLVDLPPNFTEQALRTSLEGMSLPQFMVDWIVKGIDFSSMTNTIVDTITPVIQSLALLVIAFITLFFGSMIIFFFLKILAKMITSIPVIREADKVLGVLFGIIKIG
ncbi:MAG: CvpA family protein, partial [Candidatus Izemoplasmatales bacterium]|nr:CvpA family protein [Candidatus Izemoplasmatales bacterium]